MTVMVSAYHLVVISVERYIAIVYPLHYETKFTDRCMKMAIAGAWAAGIIVGMTFALWLINADQRKCVLIPTHLCSHTLVQVCSYKCSDVLSSEPSVVIHFKVFSPGPGLILHLLVCVFIRAQVCCHTFQGGLSPCFNLVYIHVQVCSRTCCHTFPGVFLYCLGHSLFPFLPRCVLIPAHYQLIDFLAGYLPVCVSMFVCYGKILAIAWRQRQRIEPVANDNLACRSASAQVTAGDVTQSSDPTGTDNNQHPADNALSGTSVILVSAKDLVSYRSIHIRCFYTVGRNDIRPAKIRHLAVTSGAYFGGLW